MAGAGIADPKRRNAISSRAGMHDEQCNQGNNARQSGMALEALLEPPFSGLYLTLREFYQRLRVITLNRVINRSTERLAGLAFACPESIPRPGAEAIQEGEKWESMSNSYQPT